MNELEQILSADSGALIASVQNETRKMLVAKQGRIVFFGAGRLGEIALRNARHLMRFSQARNRLGSKWTSKVPSPMLLPVAQELLR